MSQQKLFKSKTLAYRDTPSKYFGEQQEYTGIKCKEDQLSTRTQVRQEVHITQDRKVSKILLNLRSREDKKTTREMESKAIVTRSIVNTQNV